MNVGRDLLVLGASNEIGPTSYIRYITGRTIMNASVGACSSLAGILMLGLHQIPENGYCLLNYELNEHGIIQSNLRTEREVRQIWKALIEETLARNACPIVFTLPRFAKGQLVRTSTCDMNISIAEELGMPYLDGSRLFIDLFESGVKAEDLMVDNAHLTERARKLFGDAVNGLLDQLDRMGRKRAPRDVQKSPFHISWASDLSVGELVKKRSSLSEGSLRQLTAGDKIELPLTGTGFEIVGISVNRKSLGAALNAPGLCKHLNYDQAGQDGFMRVVADIRALAIPGDTAEFTLSPIEHTHPTEKTWLSARDPKTLECSLEVECFIFRDTKLVAKKIEHDHLDLPDLNLLNLLGKNFMDSARHQMME